MTAKRPEVTTSTLMSLREKMESGELGLLDGIRTWIERKSGISYTTRGIAKLLKRELGARRGWVFRSSSAHRLTVNPNILDKHWPTLEETAAFLNTETPGPPSLLEAGRERSRLTRYLTKKPLILSMRDSP